MPKQEKLEAVQKIKNGLTQSAAAILAEFRGLKVEEFKELRRRLAEGGAEFKVVKNTLTRLAVRDAKLDELLPMLEGSTAIAFVEGDPILAAKSLDEISKKFPALVIKGGLIEGRVLDATQAQSLAKLRPRDVLLAELVGLFQAPIQKMAILLSAPLRDLGYALAAFRQKRDEEQPPEATAQKIPTEKGPATEEEPETPTEK